MFKLTAVITPEAFESLTEPVDPKELYTKNEKDNTYVLGMDGAEAGLLAKPLQAENARLKGHNETLVEEKRAVEENFKAYKELGKTPEELTALINDKTPADVSAIVEQHKTEMASLRTSVQQEKDAAAAQVLVLDKQLQKTLLGAAIDKAIRDNTATPLAFDFLINRSKIEKIKGENGQEDQYVVRVLDDNGEVAYKGGAPMTPGQLLEDKKTDPIFGGMFFAGEAGGSGQRPTGTGVSTKGTINADDANAIGANLEDIASGKVKVTGLGE